VDARWRAGRRWARMIECVANVSEGRDAVALARLAEAARPALLDVHADAHHHRSVFTLAGAAAARPVAELAVELLDVRAHAGVHPRLGVVDVVPFVPLASETMASAVAARDDFARWAADQLGVPCFLYGPERTLPDIRRRAWQDLGPDVGPPAPHVTAGAMCVGARPVLVAYNLWLARADLALAKRVAALVRGPSVRALGLPVGDHVQVSMNLVNPHEVGPATAFDLVAAHADVARAELVGLVPASVLASVPVTRWTELDLSVEQTLEYRLGHPPRR
jgi:glutamate formiminotransferase / 5-formyltetrahydrofolate cyclo-ligase